MTQYEVELEIQGIEEGKLIEFRWGEDTLRSNSSSVTLLIEAVDESEIVDIVRDSSHKTLKILTIKEFTDEGGIERVELLGELLEGMEPMGVSERLHSEGFIASLN